MEVLRFILFFGLLGYVLEEKKKCSKIQRKIAPREVWGDLGQVGEAWGVTGGSWARLGAIFKRFRTHLRIILGYLFVCFFYIFLNMFWDRFLVDLERFFYGFLLIFVIRK